MLKKLLNITNNFMEHKSENATCNVLVSANMLVLAVLQVASLTAYFYFENSILIWQQLGLSFLSVMIVVFYLINRSFVEFQAFKTMGTLELVEKKLHSEIEKLENNNLIIKENIDEANRKIERIKIRLNRD